MPHLFTVFNLSTTPTTLYPRNQGAGQMAYKMYRLLADSKISPEVKAGAVVYDIRGYDYGLAAEDTMMTGVLHISVTTNDDSGYPSFTIPKTDLQELGDAPFYTDMIAARKAGA